MASDPRKRQKKQERRTAKRKEKKHIAVRAQAGGLPDQLTTASRCPVLNCWMGTSFANHGIGWVVLSREIPGGLVAASSFLVDQYCLGVKDTFAEVLPHPAYNAKYLRKAKEMELRQASPAEARKFLEAAVAYAHSLGLRPHAGYSRAMILFGDIDPAESDATFEFGKDGKPFFIAGPNDGPERCEEIMAILRKNCGPGKHNFMIPIGREEGERMMNLPGAKPEELLE